MTREEHKAIIAFIDRAVASGQAPMDVEADAIIRALFVKIPDAAYRVTMLAMALSEAGQAEAPAPPLRPRGWFANLFDRRGPAPIRQKSLIS